MIFFEPPFPLLQNGFLPRGAPPPRPPSPNLKMKPPQLKNNPPLKSEASFQEIIPRKNPETSETVINTCVSIIKQDWKKMVEIPQKCNFFHLEHLKFRKKNETVC